MYFMLIIVLKNQVIKNNFFQSIENFPSKHWRHSIGFLASTFSSPPRKGDEMYSTA